MIRWKCWRQESISGWERRAITRYICGYAGDALDLAVDIYGGVDVEGVVGLGQGGGGTSEVRV